MSSPRYVNFDPMWKNFGMAARLALIGLEFKNFDRWNWYVTVTKYAEDLDPNQKGLLGQGIFIYPVEALVKSMNEITDRNDAQKLVDSGFTFRRGALVEIWGYMKKFSEQMDPEELKKSTLVQNFIEKGYADVYRYNNVPETEFNDFAAKYITPETEAKIAATKAAAEAAAAEAAAAAAAEEARKKSFMGRASALFGKGGRKSRNHNKSRKQGKSRKQRKSRK